MSIKSVIGWVISFLKLSIIKRIIVDNINIAILSIKWVILFWYNKLNSNLFWYVIEENKLASYVFEPVLIQSATMDLSYFFEWHFKTFEPFNTILS